MQKVYSVQCKMSGHTLFFRASTSCSKILNVKVIFNTVQNVRAHAVFQGKRNLLKNLECKNFRALCFQGKRKLLKNPECKKYIQHSETFQGTLCFQGKRKLLKNPECKNIY